MKTIIIQDAEGANHFIRSSIVNAYRAAGYNVYFWNKNSKSAFDLFNELNNNILLYIGDTWQSDRALVKCLNSQPETKVILYADIWGDIQDTLDVVKYPVGIATDEQKKLVETLTLTECGLINIISNHGSLDVEDTHGKWRSLGLDVHSVLVSADTTQYFPRSQDENYKAELAYVGGYWPFKGRNLDQYILPLTFPTTAWRVKLFGNGWNVVNGLGTITNDEAAKFYSNASVIPHVVEPHCSDIYSDIPLRYMEVPACGGFGISCPCVGIRDVFTEDELIVADSPADFIEKIVFYLNNPDLTIPFREKARSRVLSEHTGFHRVKQLLEMVGEDTTVVDRIISQITFDQTGY